MNADIPPEPQTSVGSAPPYNRRKASLQLEIVIVGAGIAGLSSAFYLTQAGHRVTVIECADTISDIGAGIQISPNMSRLLCRWGLKRRLEEVGVKPLGVRFHRYATDELVGHSLFGDSLEKAFGAPYYHVHRGDLIQMLYEKVKPFITLVHGEVIAILSDPRPTATLQSGVNITGDVLIGADGVKSTVRSFITYGADEKVNTGDLAYRALIPSAELLRDPDLRSLVETPEAMCWMGPGRHIVAYCIREKQQYNMVMIRPDTGSMESWVAQGDREEIQQSFEGWNNRVTKLVALVKAAMKSRLVIRRPLKTWIHEGGRIALIGDACHSMLPYYAQGAAMAVEDAAVLGNLFSRVSNLAQIKPLLRAYQDIRLPRTAATQTVSHNNQLIFHLPDGQEQEARDASMRAAMAMAQEDAAGKASEGNSNVFADKTKLALQYGYDADEAADLWWENNGARLERSSVLVSKM